MNEQFLWYEQLVKPSWAPPAWLFGPVWTFLYVLIALSFGWVFYSALRRRLSWWVALPFVLNLLFNFAFTPVQFGLRSNLGAALIAMGVWATLIWGLIVIWRYAKPVVYANIPHLLWVSFAIVLQWTITALNGP